jgi:hypothetical protein
VQARGFEHVNGAFHINALVKSRLFETGADPGPRSQVDDLIEPSVGDDLFDRNSICQIAMHELEPGPECFKVAQVPAFESGIVKVVQIVEDANAMAFSEKTFRDM